MPAQRATVLPWAPCRASEEQRGARGPCPEPCARNCPWAAQEPLQSPRTSPELSPLLPGGPRVLRTSPGGTKWLQNPHSAAAKAVAAWQGNRTPLLPLGRDSHTHPHFWGTAQTTPLPRAGCRSPRRTTLILLGQLSQTARAA